jgi:hypothetical protein
LCGGCAGLDGGGGCVGGATSALDRPTKDSKSISSEKGRCAWIKGAKKTRRIDDDDDDDERITRF